MSDQLALGATPHAPALASVQACGTRIDYHRAGSGTPVLLLHERAGDAPPWPPLAAALAVRCCVIVPAIPDVTRCRDSRTLGWMRTMLEGLGLPRVSIVAAEPLGIDALGFALANPDLARRLVLLRDTPPKGMTNEPRPDRLAESGFDLLVAEAASEAGERAVVGFLAR